MELPSICLPLQPTPSTASNSERSGLTKGVFCLQRCIPCQNNASFLVVWRHSPGTHNEGSTHKHAGVNKRLTPRAHSDVFLLTQIAAGGERGADDTIENEKDRPSARWLAHLDIERPDNSTTKILRRAGFDAGVMAPLLFYMKRVTSEIANCVNLGCNTRQACGTLMQNMIGYPYNKANLILPRRPCLRVFRR